MPLYLVYRSGRCYSAACRLRLGMEMALEGKVALPIAQQLSAAPGKSSKDHREGARDGPPIETLVAATVVVYRIGR